MILKATYVIQGANPFVADIGRFLRQFRYATATVPDDADWAKMEQFAREKTPEGFVFVKMEKIDK